MFWDVHMHKITFMERRTKKQERLEINYLSGKTNEISQNNSKSLYEIHKLYFLRTGMDSHMWQRCLKAAWLIGKSLISSQRGKHTLMVISMI